MPRRLATRTALPLYTEAARVHVRVARHSESLRVRRPPSCIPPLLPRMTRVIGDSDYAASALDKCPTARQHQGGQGCMGRRGHGAKVAPHGRGRGAQPKSGYRVLCTGCTVNEPDRSRIKVPFAQAESVGPG